MDALKELFDVTAKKDTSNKGEKVIALVHTTTIYDYGKTFHSRRQSLADYLLNKGIDLNEYRVIPMEDGRILNTVITDEEFEKVYYGNDISLGVYKYLKENFSNLEYYEIEK